MKTNPNDYIHTPVIQIYESPEDVITMAKDPEGTVRKVKELEKGGLTKREWMATQIASGMAAAGSYWSGTGRSLIPRDAVAITDALIQELNV